MDKNSVEKSNSFKLLVLDEISKNPYFFKRNNLIRYEIPKENQSLDRNTIASKVTAVWDLKNEGAFNTDNQERVSKKFEFVFLLEILQPEFNQIHKRYKNLAPLDKSLDGTRENKSKPLTNSIPDLISVIPRGGKYTVNRRIASLFYKDKEVKNYLLARCIRPTIIYQQGNRRKLAKKDYLNSKKRYDERIKNRFRFLKKIWKPLGYTLKFYPQLSTRVIIQK